jgi:pantoate kinase
MYIPVYTYSFLYKEPLIPDIIHKDLTNTLNNRKNVPKLARAFVPGHITGFFQIHDDAQNPQQRGSRGAGFSVAIGTLTTVSVTENDSLEITTTYNDEEIEAQVTSMVIRRMVEDYKRQFKVKVAHKSSLPSGAGFGASGAGALGAALALGNILDSTMSYDKAASYAHEAEILNHTGLGDVLAQTRGGMEIRVRPGGPGVGEIIRIDHIEPQYVVLAGAPGLKTHDVLTNSESRQRINNVGEKLVERIISKPDLMTFISCSRKFAESIGLASKRVIQALRELDGSGFKQSSMVMLGDSVFCFCNEATSGSVIDILCKYWDSTQVMSTTISDNGGRLASW